MLEVMILATDPLASNLLQRLVDQTPGFRSTSAADRQSALKYLDRNRTDLILVDLTNSPTHGLSFCRALAALERPPDLLILTTSTDLATLRAAVRLGALHVLLLPIDRITLHKRLQDYGRYRAATTTPRRLTTQHQVDLVMMHLRDRPPPPPPSGTSEATLTAVRATVLTSTGGLSAIQVARLTGLSRVTARRYLEHLVARGECLRVPVRGRRGRPELRYSSTVGPDDPTIRRPSNH